MPSSRVRKGGLAWALVIVTATLLFASCTGKEVEIGEEAVDGEEDPADIQWLKASGGTSEGIPGEPSDVKTRKESVRETPSELRGKVRFHRNLQIREPAYLPGGLTFEVTHLFFMDTNANDAEEESVAALGITYRAGPKRWINVLISSKERAGEANIPPEEKVSHDSVDVSRMEVKGKEVYVQRWTGQGMGMNQVFWEDESSVFRVLANSDEFSVEELLKVAESMM